MDLPLYRSHKQVWAAQIVTATQLPLAPGNEHIDVKPLPQFSLILSVDGKEIEHTSVPGFCARGVPSQGDYFVLYPDGYESWSPKAAFEEGYQRVEGH